MGSMPLLVVGDPRGHGVCDGAGEVALLPAEPLDGREPERLLQLIGDDYTDAPHVHHRRLSFLLCVRAHALDVVPVSKVPDAGAVRRACSCHRPYHLAYLHYIICSYQLIKLLVYVRIY